MTKFIRHDNAKLWALIQPAQRIGIIGYPGAGKTTFANSICAGKQLLHTDAYLHIDHEQRPAVILQDLEPPFVVEGSEVTRLITRGLIVDLLILVEGTTRMDKSVNGLKGRVDKFIDRYSNDIIVINPRTNK